MSRVGKRPISIPDSIQVSVDKSKIIFKSAKTTREIETYGRVKIELQDKEIVFSAIDSTPQSKAFWGTYRALVNNIVIGLTSGFTKILEINGVGYKASVAGKTLELALGFSHPIKYPIPVHVGQAPIGLLNENILGVNSGKLKPQSGHA